MSSTDDQGTLTHARPELPDLKDRPTPLLVMLGGMLLGAMLFWLVAVIVYGPPPRYSGLRPEVQLMLVIGAVIGLIVGGFITVMIRSRGGSAAAPAGPAGRRPPTRTRGRA